jgi:TRAP-type C4-dicarboxylate transport system substrate-binding protein
MMNRFLLALTAMVVGLSSLTGAAQAQTVEWRFNNSYAASRPESVQIRAFAADVEKRTNGRMKISVSEGGRWA